MLARNIAPTQLLMNRLEITCSRPSNYAQIAVPQTSGSARPYHTTHDHTRSDTSRRRLIFISLVTVSILLGIFPHPHLLAAFDLCAQFLPLIHAIKLGDRSAFRMHLDHNMDWFLDRYIYIILRTKGEVLVIRSLFRRAYVPSCSAPPAHTIALDLCISSQDPRFAAVVAA